MNAWQGFKEGRWTKEIDVRGFIQANYTPYEGDDSFLAGATENTKQLWEEVMELFKKERENGGTLDVDTKTVSAIDAYAPGYINKDKETVVGLQTDAPLKRAIMPEGGIRMVESSCEAYGFKCDPLVSEIFTKYRKTHNQGVFDAYTTEMRAARKSGIITGLPDAYGRGRIIGDYRRVALYGVDRLMDHFVMKLRMVKFLRTPDYNELFSGDPTWVTESIGGMGVDGRTLVTKNSFRVLNTLYTIGPSPEPNLTVLWSKDFPQGFKDFCSKVSIDTSSVQYENDDLMRPYWGDDYGIACCVSAMRIGKQMQFFGARVNLAKTLLYAINGGVDEKSGAQVGPRFEPIMDEYLDYDKVMERFEPFTDWLANLYVNTLNVIHYMHDKYSYEALEMALHDRDVFRTMACGIAGLSVAADSLSAIKYAKVKTIRNEAGVAVDFEIEGDYPKYGNNDDRVDDIAIYLVESMMNKIRKNKTYRNSVHTQSVLTITSNVVYGKKTGNTPCGRRAGAPFAPGANPMHGRDNSGALASLSSVAKLPYEHSQDGISNTFSIVPGALGKDMNERVRNLSCMMDGYFTDGAHHLNVNVFDRATLEDAMEHPEKYPQLTIRVSGYAVNFIKLTKEQQLDVINRTFHGKMA